MQTGKQQSRNSPLIYEGDVTPFQSYITEVRDDSENIRSQFHFTVRRTKPSVKLGTAKRKPKLREQRKKK
jgi:hypothetical protein